MKKLDRFIIKSFVAPFMAALVVVVFILLLQFLWVYIDELAPLIVCSAVIAVGAFFIGNRLVPKAFAEIYTMRDDIMNTKNEIKIPSGIFYDGIEGYTIRVDRQNKKSKMLYGVTVYDHASGRGNTALA